MIKISSKTVVEVETLSHDGRGVAHLEGKTIFIDGALPGEKVTFTYTKRHPKFDEAKVNEVLQSAATRTLPLCPHFGICGGCSLQHMHTEAQLHHKQEILLEQIKHFGNIEPDIILAPITGPIWHYRHKARLGVRYVAKKNSALVGFCEKGSRFLADLQSCHIIANPVGQLITPLKQLITDLNAKNTIPQIEVAIGDDESALIIRHLKDLSEHDQQKIIAFAEKFSVRIYLQPKGTESIYLFWPTNIDPQLTYALPEFNLKFYFYPQQFSQINPIINRKMVQRTIELLDPQPQEKIMDLFCGIGNFTLPIAHFCKQVTGVEGLSSSVQQAELNAQYNHINNVKFHCFDLNKNLDSQGWAQEKYDKILLDPPRSGAIELLSFIGKMQANRVVYISCNPATLARDIGILNKEFSYKLTAAGILDMFPHTSHVESIAVLQQ